MACVEGEKLVGRNEQMEKWQKKKTKKKKKKRRRRKRKRN